jgi:amino-acid N-acetyltransferase
VSGPQSSAVDAAFSVRPATPADLSAVCDLLASAALPTADVGTQFGARYAIAASTDGRTVGAEGIEVYGRNGSARYGLLRSAVVAESWRGRGVGDALTRNRLAWARDEGLEALFLLTTTAASYFRRFGFEEVARAEIPAAVLEASEFTTTCPGSATVMRLVVGGRA